MFDLSDRVLLKQRQQVREMAQGFRQAQILLDCIDLGVFEATAAEVATALRADARGG
jgi:hypothetical protein